MVDVVQQSLLERKDVLQVEVVELAVGAGPYGHDFLFRRVRVELRLLQQLGQVGTTGQLGLGSRIQIGGEHGEGFQRTVLCQGDLQRTGDLLQSLGLCGATDSRDGDTDVHGGALVGVEQIGLQEDLAVSDGDHVGRDVGGHIVRLGLDDRQTRHRTAAQVIGDLGATFEQAGVQVEHITRVGFTPRRAAQQQGNRTIGLCLLGQVIEDDEHMLAVVHPVLADGRAGVRGDVLEASGIGCRGGHDGGVLHGAGVFQALLHRGDGGALLADGHVDAADLLLRITGFPITLLVDDRIDCDSGLTGLAVANDELALATADRRHCVDGLQTGGHWLVNRMTMHNVRCLGLENTTAFGLDLAKTINRVA